MPRIDIEHVKAALKALKPRDTLINRIAEQLDLIDQKLAEGVSHTDIAAVFGVGLKQFSCALAKARTRCGQPARRKLDRPPLAKPKAESCQRDLSPVAAGSVVRPGSKAKTVRQSAEEMKAAMQLDAIMRKAFKGG